MKNKIFIFLLGLTLFLFFPRITLAACTTVGTNQTTCTGTQSVPCSQQLPVAGGLKRWCCDDQPSCDQAKGEVQQQISNKLGVFQLCDNGKGIPTAIGCIPALGSQEDLFGFILKWAIGVGGGIAFLLIVYAGFMIMTSQGNPERLKAGQELLTAAISGVVLLVLSVFVLNAIGVTILKIPGFGQ